MKIGIVGYGFVGKALANGLKDSVDLSIIDPKIGTSIKDLETINPENEISNNLELVSFALPEEKKECKMIDSENVEELVNLLKDEAKVL